MIVTENVQVPISRVEINKPGNTWCFVDLLGEIVIKISTDWPQGELSIVLTSPVYLRF